MESKLEKTAKRYDRIVKELEFAIQHFRTAANHFRGQEIARGSAHAYAGLGHITKSDGEVRAAVIEHAENSLPH